jgi:hypothetical protein
MVRRENIHIKGLSNDNNNPRQVAVVGTKDVWVLLPSTKSARKPKTKGGSSTSSVTGSHANLKEDNEGLAKITRDKTDHIGLIWSISTWLPLKWRILVTALTVFSVWLIISGCLLSVWLLDHLRE